MRVSSAAWFATSLPDCLDRARSSAVVTHDHPEAVRAAIYAGLAGWDQHQTRHMVAELFGYDLSQSVDALREASDFEVKAWISVPRAMVCAFEATSFEDAIRNAVSLGGDADTEAAIAGSIAETWFAIPQGLLDAVLERVPSDMRDVLAKAEKRVSQLPPSTLSDEDIARVPRWDPQEVKRWEHTRESSGQKENFARFQTMKALEKKLAATSIRTSRPTLLDRLMRILGR